MEFKLLNESEEQLLQELIEHRDKDYWRNRFDEINKFPDADIVLRGTFKELQDDGMINVLWADNFNYETIITHKGLTYFKDKQIYRKDKLIDSAKSVVKDIAVNVISNMATKT